MGDDIDGLIDLVRGIESADSESQTRARQLVAQPDCT
jgi:hypothetical protein